MAHNIFGKRFLSTREPAWHGLGLSWTGQKTAVEAVADSRVDQIVIGTRRMGWELPDGTFEPIGDRVVIVRNPTPDDKETVRLGEAGPDYTVIQNTALAQALDKAGLTARWPVETCAALGRGETIFICLNMGKDTVAGDEHDRYAIFCDTRDGGSSLLMLTTHTRVVCANTLQIAMENGDIKLTLQHGRNMATDFAFALDVIDQVEANSARVKQALERLQTIPVTDQDLPALWDATYPAPRKGQLLRQYERVDDPSRYDPATLARLEKLAVEYTYQRQMRETVIAAAKERYDVLCQTAPHLAGNGLGFVNTVAEIADHTRCSRGGVASIIGNRAEEKIRAHRALLALVG